MKVPYILISVVLHVAILRLPVSFVGESREEVFPITLVLSEATKENKGNSSSQAQQRKEPEPVSPQKPKRPRVERAKDDGRGIIQFSAEEENLLRELPITSSEEEVIDRTLETEFYPRYQASLTDPRPTARAQKHLSHTQKGQESLIAIVEKGVFDSANRDLEFPKPQFQRASYDHAPRPRYPELARREGWEGVVLLSILVNPEGKPEAIILNHSSGFNDLDRAAQEAVKRWRFQPARYGKTNVESWVKVPIIFTLAEATN